MSGKSTSVFALEHVRRMRGGAQSQLLRCSDGEYYVVKFQNNPQGVRILVNELLASILAKRLGLPVPEMEIVYVDGELIRFSEELVIELGRGRERCQPGLCFGSKYPRDPAASQHFLPAVHALLPEAYFRDITNMSDFVGMLVFDKWTGNTDDRQSVFFRNEGQLQFTALMIDSGFCFNGQEWNFPDTPRLGVSMRAGVYEQIRGIEAFDWWISRLEHEIDESFLTSAFEAIPAEWYRRDERSFRELIKVLDCRRALVRSLLCATVAKLPKFFPNWIGTPSESRVRGRVRDPIEAFVSVTGTQNEY
jgi:hypothetical protein